MSERGGEPGGGRQTRSYLMERLQAHGLRPRRQLGQNFLIDLNLLELLASSAAPPAGQVALEVGAGTAGLTCRLADLYARVVSVEIDPGFFELARRETQSLPNVTILRADALEGKNRFNQEVLGVLAQAMKDVGTNEFHLVANLPYDVATSVISNLLLEDLFLRSATITVQFEMAERLIAAPGSKDYGPVSVLVSRLGVATLVRTLPPEVFWPRPKVRSAIVRIDVDPARRGDLPALRRWHRFVRDLFLHRRKSLRGGIIALTAYKPIKPKIDSLLTELGLRSQDRAEMLTPDDLTRLFAALEQCRETSASSS